MRTLSMITVLLMGHLLAFSQPEVPIEQWKDKTILLIGAHPDDDTYSMGTLGLLNANGNDIHVVIMTTGNVGTQDPDLSMGDLARIRTQEELAALAEMGISADHYTNLGYDDGMLEYENKKEVVSRLVRVIRTVHPDVIFAFDPGKGYQRWHKADHRAAALYAADAARAAMWPLLFQGQITAEGLEAHTVQEYVLYDSAEQDKNTWVDISSVADRKVEAMSKYVSQWSSGWNDYQGPELPEEEAAQIKERLKQRMEMKDGIPVEGFRYYRGLPDGIGR